MCALQMISMQNIVYYKKMILFAHFIRDFLHTKCQASFLTKQISDLPQPRPELLLLLIFKYLPFLRKLRLSELFHKLTQNVVFSRTKNLYQNCTTYMHKHSHTYSQCINNIDTLKASPTKPFER